MSREVRLDLCLKQGRTAFGLDFRMEDADGRDVVWDDATQGNLMVRGHWVASAYYRMPETSVGDDGWFPTGDVAKIDPHGYVTLTDRTKDLIKSGGEWISSIALENIAVGHPDVAEAAAIAATDPKWGERPVMIVVARPGCSIDPEALREHSVAGFKNGGSRIGCSLWTRFRMDRRGRCRRTCSGSGIGEFWCRKPRTFEDMR